MLLSDSSTHHVNLADVCALAQQVPVWFNTTGEHVWFVSTTWIDHSGVGDLLNTRSIDIWLVCDVDIFQKRATIGHPLHGIIAQFSRRAAVPGTRYIQNLPGGQRAGYNISRYAPSALLQPTRKSFMQGNRASSTARFIQPLRDSMRKGVALLPEQRLCRVFLGYSSVRM